jgi:hypothetical protein
MLIDKKKKGDEHTALIADLGALHGVQDFLLPQIIDKSFLYHIFMHCATS